MAASVGVVLWRWQCGGGGVWSVAGRKGGGRGGGVRGE